MTIAVGDSIPAVRLQRLTDEGMVDIDTGAIFGPGRKVVLFAVPGAFTPTCSATHLPGFVAQADALRAKGVDEIVCLSVNDPHVMKAWADAHGAGDKVSMLPDGSAVFTRALGMELDFTARGWGIRCKRFAMIVEDGKVVSLGIDPVGVDLSGASACLAKL